MGVFSTPSQNAVQKTLDATFSAGANTCVLNEDISTLLPDVSTDHPGCFVVDRVDSNDAATPTKREYCTFTGVSGATLTGITKNADSSGSDQEHSVGAVVEFIPDVLWAKSIKDYLVQTDSDNTFTGTNTFGDGKLVADNPTFTNLNIAATDAALTTPKITTSINDANGNEVIKTPATTSAVNEVTITNAATGGNPLISATGGDNNLNLDLKAKGTGTVRKPSSLIIQVVAGTYPLTTGDGKYYISIPPELNGMNLVSVFAHVITAGTTNTTDIQINNVTDTVDMLSTKLTIDSGENTSATAATPAVIDTTKDDVATNDLLRIDIDQVSTTAPQGLIVRLGFALP